MTSSGTPSHNPLNAVQTAPRLNIPPNLLLLIGLVACVATPYLVRASFTSGQLANSPVPFIVFLAIPAILSLIVVLLGPKTPQFAARWILLGVAAFFIGAILDIRLRPTKGNLVGIELILLTGLSACLLSLGTGLARLCHRLAPKRPH